MDETIAEVLAHLDDFERDMVRMTVKIREYRHTLFAALSAAGLDSPPDDLLD